MANKQVRHWYDKVAKTEKLNELAWMARRGQARRLWGEVEPGGLSADEGHKRPLLLL